MSRFLWFLFSCKSCITLFSPFFKEFSSSLASSSARTNAMCRSMCVQLEKTVCNGNKSRSRNGSENLCRCPNCSRRSVGNSWFGMARFVSLYFLQYDFTRFKFHPGSTVQLHCFDRRNPFTFRNVYWYWFVSFVLFRFFFCYFTYHTCFVLFTAFYSLVLVLLFMFPHSLFHYCSYLLTVC